MTFFPARRNGRANLIDTPWGSERKTRSAFRQTSSTSSGAQGRSIRPVKRGYSSLMRISRSSLAVSDATFTRGCLSRISSSSHPAYPVAPTIATRSIDSPRWAAL